MADDLLEDLRALAAQNTQTHASHRRETPPAEATSRPQAGLRIPSTRNTPFSSVTHSSHSSLSQLDNRLVGSTGSHTVLGGKEDVRGSPEPASSNPSSRGYRQASEGPAASTVDLDRSGRSHDQSHYSAFSSPKSLEHHNSIPHVVNAATVGDSSGGSTGRQSHDTGDDRCIMAEATDLSADVCVDEEALYRAPELIQEKPRDVVHFLEEEGVVKLGEMEVNDSWVLKAFGQDTFLTQGHEHADVDWRTLWLQRLSEGGRMSSGTGWTSGVVVEAHVVNLLDAAAEGSEGLLRPLLRRHNAGGLPTTVFALPAVQAIVQFKWQTWARSFLMWELMVYIAWMCSFSLFTMLVVKFYTPLPIDPSYPTPAAPDVPSLGLFTAPSGWDSSSTSRTGGIEQYSHTTSGWTGGVGGRSLPAAAAIRRLLLLSLRAAQLLQPAHSQEVGQPPVPPLSPSSPPPDGGMADGGDVEQPSVLVHSLALVCVATSCVCLVPFLWMELKSIAAYRWNWLSVWNMCDMVSFLLQVIIAVIFIHGASFDQSWFSVLLAVQHVLMWGKVHYYLRVLSPAHSCTDTVRIVLMDLRPFIIFLTLVMVGFGFAFYSLYRNERNVVSEDCSSDFSSLWHSMASMFAYLVMMFDTSVLWESSHPRTSMILFGMFEFFVVILLLNVLIAIMVGTFNEARQDEGIRFIVYRAQVIDELEASLPSWVKRWRKDTWYPRIVHILKISPDEQYDVNLGAIWTGMGGVQSNLMGAQLEARLRVDELERHVDRMHEKVDFMTSLFFACGGGSGGALRFAGNFAGGGPSVTLAAPALSTGSYDPAGYRSPAGQGSSIDLFGPSGGGADDASADGSGGADHGSGGGGHHHHRLGSGLRARGLGPHHHRVNTGGTGDGASHRVATFPRGERGGAVGSFGDESGGSGVAGHYMSRHLSRHSHQATSASTLGRGAMPPRSGAAYASRGGSMDKALGSLSARARVPRSESVVSDEGGDLLGSGAAAAPAAPAGGGGSRSLQHSRQPSGHDRGGTGRTTAAPRSPRGPAAQRADYHAADERSSPWEEGLPTSRSLATGSSSHRASRRCSASQPDMLVPILERDGGGSSGVVPPADTASRCLLYDAPRGSLRRSPPPPRTPSFGLASARHERAAATAELGAFGNALAAAGHVPELSRTHSM